MNALAWSSLALAVAIAAPQQAGETLEVAAIHVNHSGGLNTQISRRPGGHLLIVNASLKTMVRNAYSLLGFQIAGGPKWLDDEMFDLNAETTSHRDLSDDDVKPLLQQILAERFQLKFHWENRESSIYALVLSKGGPKVQPYGGSPNHGMNTSRAPDRTQMRGTDVPMADLATNLSNQLGRYVIDETGLAGRYDFLLHFDPNQSADSQEPNLFTALEEQLGLKLESRKGPMKVLVIDSVEQPSEN